MLDAIASTSPSGAREAQQALITELRGESLSFQTNRWLIPKEVELRYASMFIFGFATPPLSPPVKRFTKAWLFRNRRKRTEWDLCQMLAQKRLQEIEACRDHYRYLFQERFGAVENAKTLQLVPKPNQA